MMKLYFNETNQEVELPQALIDFRGDERLVLRVAVDSSPGKSGKVEVQGGRLLYPSVFDCYIAEEDPRKTEEAGG